MLNVWKLEIILIGYLISAIEHKLKPNEDIYIALFEKFNLHPEECFFVDDSERNILTGRKLGMDGYVFDWNHLEGLKSELRNKNVNI